MNFTHIYAYAVHLILPGYLKYRFRDAFRGVTCGGGDCSWPPGYTPAQPSVLPALLAVMKRLGQLKKSIEGAGSPHWHHLPRHILLQEVSLMPV